MESMYLLIPVSVILVFLIGLVFWWSLRNGQFDDMEGPGYRILMDDDTSMRTSAADVDHDIEVGVKDGAGGIFRSS